MPEDRLPSSQFRFISTHQEVLSDATAFLDRYGLAIREYLCALLGPQEGEDAVSQFKIKVVRKDFAAWTPQRPNDKFRHYLQSSVKKCAIDIWRARSRRPIPVEWLDEQVTGPTHSTWLRLCHQAVLDAAMKALKAYQRANQRTNNVFYDLLKIKKETSDQSLSDDEFRELLSQKTGREFTPEHFRQIHKRARSRFALFIAAVVREDLVEPLAQDVQDELRALSLWGIVEPYLPDDWFEQARIEHAEEPG